ncbi:hypothetical protein FUA23_21930 [Neolewinella aurantiaca]|uniref:Uncharacterized protein n=1 Tax=Neolewinella aurantiaca TaxID=2602767 RepID=A0A5C7F351_9BACT|nr:hypothetical protein [Neolewinella aurantiaca]TXF81699.1 hypothetical protein FUA23_21930 [Neolewinella aurantiaca]
MNSQEWIGIHFNFTSDNKLQKWLEKYENSGVKLDEDHVTVEFGKNELKRLKNEKSPKSDLINKVIRRHLKDSDYTNIYAYIDADKLQNQKITLLEEEFNKPVVEFFFEDRKSICEIFNAKVNSSQINKILRKSELMIPLNTVFEFVRDRDFEQGQKLTLELRYEDKEEWGSNRDNLKVSIQVENP